MAKLKTKRKVSVELEDEENSGEDIIIDGDRLRGRKIVITVDGKKYCISFDMLRKRFSDFVGGLGSKTMDEHMHDISQAIGEQFDEMSKHAHSFGLIQKLIAIIREFLREYLKAYLVSVISRARAIITGVAGVIYQFFAWLFGYKSPELIS